jgi:hypothetical protein
MPSRPPTGLLFFFATCTAIAAPGSGPDQVQRPASLTLYAGQGVDLNLRQVPRAIVTGDWNRERSYFSALSYARVRNTLGGSVRELRGTPLSAAQHGYELMLLQHRGLQDHPELAAMYFVRTPALELGAVRVDFGTGAGLSHAFGTPFYEDGPRDDPQRRYRTQFAAFFELEWGLASVPAVSLVTRLQHRSGLYGVIAPRQVGSNFIAAGLRYHF